MKHASGLHRSQTVFLQEKTIECARAIGLDSEYLTKLEEQKKMRAAILRQKQERRNQATQQRSANSVWSKEERSGTSTSDKRDDRKSDDQKRTHETDTRRKRYEARNKRDQSKTERSSDSLVPNIPKLNFTQNYSKMDLESNNSIKKVGTVPGNPVQIAPFDDRSGENLATKRKAYLAVVVSSANGEALNMDRIRIIADTVGRVKVR